MRQSGVGTDSCAWELCAGCSDRLSMDDPAGLSASAAVKRPEPMLLAGAVPGRCASSSATEKLCQLLSPSPAL